MSTWKYPITLYDKQRAAVSSKADELLFGGSLGGGKTEMILKHLVDICTMVPNAKCLMLRRSFPELMEIEKRIKMRIPKAVGRYNSSEHVLRFHHNGAELYLGYLDSEDDAARYQGHEYVKVGFDELTHYDQDWVALVTSRIRATGQVKEDLDRHGFTMGMLAASNPGGRGHAWVKETFIDPAPRGTLFQGEDGVRRQFIPSSLYDNPFIDHEDYVRRLGSLDPERKRALIEGDWGIPSGVRFPQFREAVHTVKPEQLPIPVVGHARVCGVDFGFNDPYAAVWMAKVGGVIVVYREDVATELTDTQQAERILELSDDADLVHSELVVPLDEAAWRRNPSVVGNWAKSEAPLGSMAKAYMEVLHGNGAHVVKAIHGPGSRSHGWSTLDRMLVVNDNTGLPGVLIYDNCRQLIRALQSAPRDKRKPDDVDTRYKDDHVLDAFRYGYMELLGRDYHRPLGGHEAAARAVPDTVTAALDTAGF